VRTLPRKRRRGKGFVAPDMTISKRNRDVADRAEPGHWERDLMISLRSSVSGPLVEGTRRYTRLLHLPPMPW